MANLWARKPMTMLLEEAHEAGTHSLKRTLGPFQLTALGVGAVIGAGIFVLSGLGAHYAGPGLMLSFVLSGTGCAFARAAAAFSRLWRPPSCLTWLKYLPCGRSFRNRG